MFSPLCKKIMNIYCVFLKKKKYSIIMVLKLCSAPVRSQRYKLIEKPPVPEQKQPQRENTRIQCGTCCICALQIFIILFVEQ